MVSWAHPSLHPKRLVDRFSRFCTAYSKVSHYFILGHYVFAEKLHLPLGNWVPHLGLTHGGYRYNTWYLGPTRVIIPNGISIGSAVFVCVPNAMLYKALPMGK